MTSEPASADRPAPPRNRLSPKKLLLSKWTAVAPRHKERHFLVVAVVEPEPPATRIEAVELQAVHSGRTQRLPWRDLTDAGQWRQGWL
jgi:tryptophan-rich hypothetical protein